MKKQTIPEPIATAAVTMLQPYAPGLTVDKLERAICIMPAPESSEQLLTRREAAVALIATKAAYISILTSL